MGLAYPNPIDYIGIIGIVALLMAGIVKGVERLLARRDLEPPAVNRAPYPPPTAHPLLSSAMAVTPGVSLASGLEMTPAPALSGAGGGGTVPAGGRGVTGAGALTRAGSVTGEPGSATFISRTSRFRMYFLPLMYGLIPVVAADYFARQLPKFFKHASRIVPAVGHLFGAGSTSSSLYNTRILSNPAIVEVQLAVIAIGMVASMWASWRISGRELVGISKSPAAARVVALALPLACGVAAGVLYVIMHAAS